jgi:hypothetical protein
MRESPLTLAVFDWTLAVSPVGVYLFVEHAFVPASEEHLWYASPEWGIATAFLSLMTVFLLLVDLAHLSAERYQLNSGRSRLVALGMGLMMMAALVVSGRIMVAPERSLGAWLIAQWLMFFTASVIFVWAKRLSEKCRAQPRGS